MCKPGPGAPSPGDGRYSVHALRDAAARHLTLEVPASALDVSLPGGRGDNDLNADAPSGILLEGAIRPASVLVPVVEREGSAHVVLTRRRDDLPAHPGQISFPGGKLEPCDAGPVEAALREAQEEVGLGPAQVDIVGLLDTYQTATGYRVLPVVGIVEPRFSPVPDPREVSDVFEVPLSFLMTPDNHLRQSRKWQGVMRHYYAMPYNEHYIWGATAGILKNMYDRLYRP